jgi:hypothetical protein
MQVLGSIFLRTNKNPDPFGGWVGRFQWLKRRYHRPHRKNYIQKEEKRMIQSVKLLNMTNYGKKVFAVTGENLTASVLYDYFAEYFEVIIKHNDGKNATVAVWFD